MELTNDEASPRRSRRHRRATRPGAAGSDAEPLQQAGKSDPAERAAEDTDAAWGDRTDSNDDRLKRDIPPHW
jgi:hypothetical protein